MTDYEEVACNLAQSINAALFALQADVDSDKAEEILDRAFDYARENGVI